MMRLRRASVIAALSLLTSAAPCFAEDGWVLWRHYVPIYSPAIDDSRMWRAQPGTKTRAQCESEVKEYQEPGPDSHGYRIEYQCLRNDVDPRSAKGK
jgi:hypothetical protein